MSAPRPPAYAPWLGCGSLVALALVFLSAWAPFLRRIPIEGDPVGVAILRDILFVSPLWDLYREGRSGLDGNRHDIALELRCERRAHDLRTDPSVTVIRQDFVPGIVQATLRVIALPAQSLLAEFTHSQRTPNRVVAESGTDAQSVALEVAERAAIHHVATRTACLLIRGARDLTPRAVAHLLREMDAPEHRERAFAGLAELGTDAEAAVPELIHGEGRRSPEVLLVLGRVQGTHALEVLHAALREPAAEVRRAAATALSHFGPTAAETIPDLRRLAAEDSDPGVRASAAFALARIAAPEVAPGGAR